MKSFTLFQAAKACGGIFCGSEQDKNITVKSVVTDSRKITEGSLFIAIKGERVDGHDFIEQCFDKGAVCALCEKPPKTENKPYILVKSTLTAIRELASFYRSLFNIPFIGISGSVGKTSTKEMVASVLSQKYRVHKTAGNFNNELGVPLTIFGLEEDTQAAVIEMGISDFGEMTRLAKIVRPDYCIITNIGCCHLERLIDRNGVLKAKTEMLDFMQKNGKVILNGDDDKLITVPDKNGASPIFYGLSKNNEYYAEDIKNNGINGIDCTLCHNGDKLSVHIPAIGNYMVSNALCAYAAGRLMGLTDKEVANGIAAYKTVGGRANVIKTECYTVIDDCYNANPTSVKAALDTLAGFGNRKIAILGDMKELGANELALHSEVGSYAADKGIDIVIAIGPLAEKIKDGAKNTASYHFESTDEAIKQLKDIVKTGDVILVKASRAMKLESIVSLLTQQ